MILKIPLLILYVLISSSKSVHGSTIDMVVSFMSMDDKPTSLLVPYKCWSNHTLKQLARSLNYVGISIATSLQPNRSEYELHHMLILADLSCTGIDKHLIEHKSSYNDDWHLQANRDGCFKAPYRWIMVNDGNELSILDKIDILVDSDVVIAQKISDQKFIFMEAYKISENSEIIYTTRAAWRSDSQKNKDYSSTSLSTVAFEDTSTRSVSKYGYIEDYRSSKALSPRRRNLRRHILTMMNVIVDSNETKMHLNDRLNLHQDCIAKMSYAAVSLCFEMLNATERNLFTQTWGYKDKNGNWQGLIENLRKKEVDLGTLTIFTLERMEVVDYIAMVGTTAVRFVFRSPPLAMVSNIFTLPFSGPVWMAIFVCGLACSLFMYITSKWEARMQGKGPTQLDGSWTDVLILIMGALLQQGCTLEPRNVPGRCVTLILFMSLTILYSAYSANIVVLLRASSTSVRSLPDLLNSPLKFGAADFEYNRYFFKKLNDPIRKAIFEKHIAPKGHKPNYLSNAEGIARIRKGLFAFHMELNPGYRLIQETYQEDEKCDLVEIDYINERDPWVPGQKRSPFKELFKINFHKIRESGIQANIRNRLTVSRPKCTGSVSTFSNVGIIDVYSALLISLYLMMLAVVILLMEIMHKKLMGIRDQRMLLKMHDTINNRAKK